MGAFLEDEQDGKERTMYFVMMYFKGDKTDVTEAEVEDAVGKLREAITQGDFQTEPEPPDAFSN